MEEGECTHPNPIIHVLEQTCTAYQVYDLNENEWEEDDDFEPVLLYGKFFVKCQDCGLDEDYNRFEDAPPWAQEAYTRIIDKEYHDTVS